VFVRQDVFGKRQRHHHRPFWLGWVWRSAGYFVSCLRISRKSARTVIFPLHSCFGSLFQESCVLGSVTSDFPMSSLTHCLSLLIFFFCSYEVLEHRLSLSQRYIVGELIRLLIGVATMAKG